jgi:hypothetical protein
MPLVFQTSESVHYSVAQFVANDIHATQWVKLIITVTEHHNTVATVKGVVELGYIVQRQQVRLFGLKTDQTSLSVYKVQVLYCTKKDINGNQPEQNGMELLLVGN